MSIAKRAWNEALHPRDDDGRFTHKGGGTSGAPSTPTMPARQVPDISRMADNAIRRAAGRGGITRRPERGMPDAIASIPVKTKSGATIGVHRHADGSLTIDAGGRRTTMTKEQAKRFTDQLDLAQDWPRGDSEDIPGAGRITRVSGGYQVDLAGGGRLDLTFRDGKVLDQTIQRSAGSTRVDTGYGDADVFIADRNKIGFRHLGDDGRPVEIVLDKTSYTKIDRTIDRLIDEMDEDGPDRKPLYAGELSTNVGRVRVEMTGWREPGSVLRIIPAEGGDWGLVIDGSAQEAWYFATSDAKEALQWV